MARGLGQAAGDLGVERTSPLYCRYNGFLLGQALWLTCAARPVDRGVARTRITDVLRELDLDAAWPEWPGDAGSSHARLLAWLLPHLVVRSRELAEFTVLGGLITRYGRLGPHDIGAAAAILAEIERLRATYDLPPLDAATLRVPPGVEDAERLAAPGLAYLRDILLVLPIEDDTAFVSTPDDAAYWASFAAFARPALEQCGYRALREWSGLTCQAHADVVLAAIARCGLVWADVSEGLQHVSYDIGAAHALGTLTAIVVREDRVASVPASIGRDAVVRYDPDEADWPTGPALLMAACLAARKLAADRGERLRVRATSIAGVFDEVSQALRRILLPPEALAAHRRGRRALDAGDLESAEAGFDEACRLGLNDEETRLWRGWTRLGLGRFEEAATDLDAVIGADPFAVPVGEWRPIAAYVRAVLREAEGDLPAALADVDLAMALGLGDADVRSRRDTLARQLGAPALRLAPARRETASPDRPRV
jgi:tetratricopeptide (TPR) repeat protein